MEQKIRLSQELTSTIKELYEKLSLDDFEIALENSERALNYDEYWRTTSGKLLKHDENLEQAKQNVIEKIYKFLKKNNVLKAELELELFSYKFGTK